MSFDDFHFIRPYWFLVLLPAAIFIILSLRNKLAYGNWSEVCDDALLPFILQDSDKHPKRRWSSIAMSIASLLAIIALAGPTWERLPTPTFRNDAALVIALDLSRSMNATDIKPSRLIRARYKIADILQQRKDGLTALMVYAGDAFTVTPLTSDSATISNQLNALNTDIMPSQGSNTLAALNLAVELLQQGGQQQGSILLIADAINADSVAQAKDVLGNYKLSILGIGTIEGAPIKMADGGFLKDSQGNIVVPRLVTSQLTSLARTGGGTYQTISSDDSDIKSLIANTNAATTQQATDDSKHLVEQWIEQGPWLLLILLPLAALYFRKGLLVIPLIVLMNYPQDSYAYEWQYLWKTPDQQAQQAFNEQQYGQAAAQFQSPEWQAAAQYKAEKYQQAAETLQPLEQHSADIYYNQATALAKAGKLEQALKTYQKALQLNPEHQDALYNKNLVEEALQKEQQDQKQDKDKNKQQSDSAKQKQSDDKDSKSSEQSDNQQDQQNKQSEDATNDQASQDQKEQNNEHDKAQQQAEDEQQKSTEAEQKDQAKQAESEQASKKQQDAHKESAQRQTDQKSNADSEQKQAQEQWLKRIPDDPAGLLKRKFKYQYSQGNQSTQQEKTW
ncbi:MAG: VWA domain-containing protein [Pseudomonadota bacterium]|nr:VWA domain-containing protein [Pseudomonadota bacterium]